MSETEQELIKCSGCYCVKSTDNFMKDGRLMKTCFTCRESDAKRRKTTQPTDFESENNDQDDEFTGQNYNYKTRYNKYKSGDPEFDISLDDFVAMIVDRCHYCGKRNLYKGFNGIDRVDSSLPHIPGNCVSCCWPCNRMKSTMEVHDFLNQVKYIYEYLNLRNN